MQAFKKKLTRMRLILCTVLLAAFTSSVSAQVKIGPKLGANLQKIGGQSFKDGYQLGYYAGGFMEMNLGKRFQLQPEVLFSETKYDQSSDFRDIYKNILSVDSVRKIKLQQLSFPIMLNFKVANVLALQAGPQFAINMDKNKSLLQNAGDAFSDGEFAMAAGAKFMLGKFRVSGRYVVGLSDLNQLGKEEEWKSQTVQLGLGFVF